MRWPDVCRLINRINQERPELIAEARPSAGAKEHFYVRVFCIRKPHRQPIRESIASL